jgi:hypothetical protein
LQTRGKAGKLVQALQASSDWNLRYQDGLASVFTHVAWGPGLPP